MEGREEERLLSRWVVKGLFHLERIAGLRETALDDIRAEMPPKTAAHPDRAARWAVRKLGSNDETDRVLRGYLAHLRTDIERGSAQQAWRELPAPWLRREIMVHARCAALRWDIDASFVQAVGGMEPEDRTGYEEHRSEALRWARDWEEQERCRLAAARAQASGLEAARGEARRQAERAERSAQAAARRVAEAERTRRDLDADLQSARAEIATLQGLLNERDEEIASIVRQYEQRLSALARGEAAPAPLEGMTVLVVGDPSRAAAYRAEAMALGAAQVAFADGMAHPGEHVRHLAAAADRVVVCLAWCRHSTGEMLRRRVGDRLAEMRVAGLRGFREALAGSAR